MSVPLRYTFTPSFRLVEGVLGIDLARYPRQPDYSCLRHKSHDLYSWFVSQPSVYNTDLIEPLYRGVEWDVQPDSLRRRSTARRNSLVTRFVPTTCTAPMTSKSHIVCAVLYWLLMVRNL